MKNPLLPLALALVVLGGCAALPQGGGAISGVRYQIAMKAEELRCSRSVELVMKMGDALGVGWFTSYVGNCPNMQAFIKRALAQFKLVPVGSTPQE